MDYRVPFGLFKKGKPLTKGDLSFTRLVSESLVDLNVPYENSCCPVTESRPVRTNTDGDLETYVDGQWIDITGAGQHLVIKNISTPTYTLLASDSAKLLNFTNAVGVVVTIPAGLTVGYTVTIVQAGTGIITFDATAVTLNNRQSQFSSAGQYAVMSLFLTASNSYILGGDTA